MEARMKIQVATLLYSRTTLRYNHCTLPQFSGQYVICQLCAEWLLSLYNTENKRSDTGCQQQRQMSRFQIFPHTGRYLLYVYYYLYYLNLSLCVLCAGVDSILYLHCTARIICRTTIKSDTTSNLYGRFLLVDHPQPDTHPKSACYWSFRRRVIYA